MNNSGPVDVRAILEECKRKGLKVVLENDNGWRCSTFLEAEKVGDTSLSISHSGMWTCFRSGKSGHIVGLYAELIGKPLIVAKADLRTKGLIPKSYTEITTKDPTEEEKEEEKKTSEIERIMKSIRFDYDFKSCSQWRGIPVAVIQKSVDLGYMGFLDSYPVLGSCYVFICNAPPMDGWTIETKGIMLRSAVANIEKKDKWRTPATYPIWVPSWNREATHVIITEGQWDALAMQTLIEMYASSSDWSKYQVIALSGAKKIGKYPELMEYFAGKKVFFVPDNDDTGDTILAESSVILEQVCGEQKLLRVNKKYKDLNDWVREGVKQDDFEIWLESQDPFRISNGFVIDTMFRDKHRLKLNSIVEINEEGEPIEIYTGKKDFDEVVSPKYLLSILEKFPVLYDYVMACTECIESPVLFSMMSILTFEAALCGRRFWVESGSGGCLYPNLFSILVGPSGIGKSQALMMLVNTVSKVNRRLLTSEDFSAEALMDEFKDNPQRMLVSEEFSPWMQAKEGSYRFWALKNFLKMHGCENYNADHPYQMNYRKTNKVEIAEPCFSVLSACTVSQLRDINPQLLTDGVVGRFDYPIGFEKNSSIPYTKKVPKEILDKVERFFRAINGTPIRTNMSMSMSLSAKMLYEKAFMLQDEKIKSMGPNESGTYTSRWKVRFMKYAMLFEIARPMHEYEEDRVRGEAKFKRSDMVISEEAAAASLKLVGVLEKCFEEGFSNQFTSAESFSINSKLQNRIINFMKKNSRSDGTGVSRTEVFRHTHETPRVLDPILDGMVEGGLIFKKEVKIKGESGRFLNRKPKTMYLLAEEKNVDTRRLTRLSENKDHKGSNSNNGQNHHQDHAGKGDPVSAHNGLGDQHELRS